MSLNRKMRGASVIAAGLLAAFGSPALAQPTFTGDQLGELTLDATGPGSSATLSGTGASTAITITSGNPNLGQDYLTETQDVGQIYIPAGVALGGKTLTAVTLNTLLTAASTGGVHYSENSATGSGSYWQVFLADPNNAAYSIQVNADGGSNYLDQGSAVKTSAVILNLGAGPQYDGPVCGAFPGATGCGTNPSVIYATLFTGFGTGAIQNNTWADLATIAVDGTALGDWKVRGLGIATGGYGNDVTSSDTITSVTVPEPVPEPASWALMLVGFGALGVGLRRRVVAAA